MTGWRWLDSTLRQVDANGLAHRAGVAIVVVAGVGAIAWTHARPERREGYEISMSPPTASALPVSLDANLRPPHESAAADSATYKPSCREGHAEALRQLELIGRDVERSPQRALAAAHVHEQRFPLSALAPQRELLRIDALLRSGQNERARQLAEQLLAASAARRY